MRNLIAVVGNTGVGKSNLAVELARAFGGEIINADAMQMYTGLDIITNKHPEVERYGVPHHLLATTPWTSRKTVQDFVAESSAVIDRVRLPIVVGGTHYYLQSLMATDTTITTQSRALTADQIRLLDDPDAVLARLSQVDPLVCAKFHPHDHRRLRRALELYFQTGERASDLYRGQKVQARYRVLVIHVWCERQELVKRLDARVDTMRDTGMLKELRQLYEVYDGSSDMKGVFQVLGFRQFLPWLRNSSAENLSAGLDQMKAETRQYAKFQTKWIRNKLGPLVAEIGGTMAVVDSSDLARWNEDVRDRAVNITRRWLANEEEIDELVAPTVDAESLGRRLPKFTESQWVQHFCDACNVYLVGNDAYQTHLRSRAHRTGLRRKSRSPGVAG